MSEDAKPCACRCLESLRDTCDCGDASWSRVMDLRFDPLHRLILDLARCNCAGYAHGEVKVLDFGLSAAIGFLGIEDGPVLFARVLTLSKALRSERTGTFDYLTVRCSRITPDEVGLMNAVTVARQSTGPIVIRAALKIAKSERCPATLASLQALGSACRDLTWFAAVPNQTTERTSHMLH